MRCVLKKRFQPSFEKVHHIECLVVASPTQLAAMLGTLEPLYCILSLSFVEVDVQVNSKSSYSVWSCSPKELKLRT